MTQTNKKYVVPGQGDMESIKELIKRSNRSYDGDMDDILEEIHQYPLEVKKTQGYELLLGTGGPATRIVGQLNEYGEPVTAELQGQDWEPNGKEQRDKMKNSVAICSTLC